jgi:hypothetical protein
VLVAIRGAACLDQARPVGAVGDTSGEGQAWQAAMTERGWVPIGQRGVFARPPG